MRLSSLFVALLVCAGPVSAEEPQKAGTSHAATHQDGVPGSVRVVFSTRDAQLIREHYAPQYRNLPPGLQKKFARTGTLPPGWQKKLEPLPVGLERQLAGLPEGYRRGVIDGHAVIYRPDGRIVDATILF